MKKILTAAQAKIKIRHYCAYQERSHREVKDKLYSYGLHQSDVEELLTELITEGYLNEERFARAFAGGKFRMKKWGRVRISSALESKGVSQNCINIGMREISEEDYEEVLRNLVVDQINRKETSNHYELADGVSSFLIRKGYEPDLVWKILREEMGK